MEIPPEQLLPSPTEINDTHKVYSIAAWCIVLGIVASLFVIYRLGTRIHTRTFGADDYAIIPGLFLYIGWTAMAAYVNLHAGVGKPLWEITVGEYTVWFKGIIGSAWLYPAMTVSIRTSVLLLYQRIFATPQSRVRYLIYLLLALQAAYLGIYSILPAFICRPLHKAWNPLERAKYCRDWYYYHVQVALFSTSIAFDTILLVLPLYLVSKLQIPMKRRIGISVIFMLGAAASIAAAYKLSIFVIQMRRYYNINPEWFRYAMSRLIPPQFDSYGTTFWIPSQVEPAVALIGTSLPAIRQSLTSPPRFTKLWTSWWSSRTGSSRTSTSTNTNTTAATAGAAGAAAQEGAGERAPRPGPSWIKSPSDVSYIELRSKYNRLGEGV